jgi:hypothetical protein
MVHVVFDFLMALFFGGAIYYTNKRIDLLQKQLRDTLHIVGRLVTLDEKKLEVFNEFNKHQ